MKDIFQMEKDKLIGSLKCPNCQKFLDINHILENSSISWPNQDWIYFRCPFCYDYSHVEVVTDKISTGVLDGAPGPNFFTCSEQIVGNFDVNKTNEYIECLYENRKYLFKAKK